ncbi:MAG: oligosaccharide flippase family protein [Candidatus Bathyarchaeia archaeon]
MEKASEIGRTAATGSFHLFIGVAASTIIMAIGTIILGRLLTPEEYGLYSIALIPTYMMALFRDWGVNSAITKYTANLLAQNKEEEAKAIIKSGFLFETATGITLSFLLLSFSGYIAESVFKRPESASLMAIASITILAGAILTAAQSSFIGFEKMKLHSLTLIFQAIVKSIVSPILVILGFSVLGGVLGYTISFVTTALIGSAALFLSLLKPLKRLSFGKLNPHITLKKMLGYGVPLSLSSKLTGFLSQFYAFLMVIHCNNTMVGNYQIASQFAVLLTFFTTPISIVLFPSFSKVQAENDHGLLQNVYASSVKYTALLLMPATMAVMVLSKPMIGTLYGEKYAYAPTFLTLYVINNLLCALGSLSLGSFLAGLGETKTQLKLSLLNLTFGIPLALIMIPKYGIIGLIITGITAGLPSTFLGLYVAWKNYRAKADLKASTKITVTAILAAIVTFLITNWMVHVDWVELAAGIATFISIYMLLAPLTGAINHSDINNLRIMFSDMGLISKILNIPLAALEKLANTMKGDITNFKKAPYKSKS